VHDNLVLGELDALEGPAAEARTVRSRIERFGIHPARPDLPASGLSGGNQQKIVTGRVFDRMHAATEGDKPAALVLSQPTRGVDVGAASVIHEAIARAAAEGLAILVISADLAELRRLSHRILVIHRGRIVAELPPTASDEEIGRAMLGLEAA
jgi:ABC-type uncharacterized transport system ATPase subunit